MENNHISNYSSKSFSKEGASKRLAELNNHFLRTTAMFVTSLGNRSVATGTVGAMLVYIKMYNNGQCNIDQLKMMKEHAELAIDTLQASGLLRLFPLKYWAQPGNPGRKWVGEIIAKKLKDHKIIEEHSIQPIQNNDAVKLNLKIKNYGLSDKEKQELVDLNSEVLGQKMIVDATGLPTGNVGALMKRMDDYASGINDEKALDHIERIIPILIKYEFFEVFPPQSWRNTQHPGGWLIAELAECYGVINHLYSAAGKDTLIGSQYNDKVYQSFGPEGDILDGAEGNDMISYQSSKKKINIDLSMNEASAIENGQMSKDKLTNFENVEGTRFNDRLIGNAKNNILDGGDGNDFLDAREGDDTLYGGDGYDILKGGLGKDVLWGGRATDLLVGGEGDDLLIGGLGDDWLRGGKGNDIYYFLSGDGKDMIHDTGGNSDTLQFGQGITKEQLRFSRRRDNLILDFDNKEDQIVIFNHFKGDRLEKIQLYDSRVINFGEVDKLVELLAQNMQSNTKKEMLSATFSTATDSSNINMQSMTLALHL